MPKSTTGKLRNRDSELSFEHHETDSPIIPVAQLERLHNFRPDAVDWVINQTQIEGEHRRKEQKRINSFVFIERIIGQLFAALIGLSGIGSGSYMALHGQPGAGTTIASLSLGGLAVVFLTGRTKPSPKRNT